MLFNQGQTVDWSKWDSQAYPINFDRQIKNHTPIYQSACLTFFFKCWLLVMPYAVGASIVFPPKQIHLPELPESAISAVARYILLKRSKGICKKNKNLSSEGEIPPIWPAIRGDSRMPAVCETSGRVSLLFAHFKVKSDSSVNPLWTSLTACVIWNATHPPVQNFCHASQSGQLLMETMFLSGMWWRDGGGVWWLDASGVGGFLL